MFYVLDASAMLAYLRNEPGAEIVEDALTAPDSHCFAHSINLCEVFYDFFRSAGETMPSLIYRPLESESVATSIATFG